MQSDDGFQAEIRAVFREESLRYLTRMSQLLEKVCSSFFQDETGSFEELGRLAHSIKGSAMVVGYGETARCALSLETLFQAIADGEIPWSGELAWAAADAVDALTERIPDLDTGDGLDGALLVAAHRLDLAVRSERSRPRS